MVKSSAYLRKPGWFRSLIPGGGQYVEVSQNIKDGGLHTVCESASCPNLGECWKKGTATFMILGNLCTRGCRFCDVPKGKPTFTDFEEPQRVAEAAKKMNLNHVVITSVNRDELPDQGAQIWAQTIETVREYLPKCTIETLIPDMQGKLSDLNTILDARPNILNHNFETVRSMQQSVRGRGNIEHSSLVLSHAKSRGFITKTSLMVGMGETKEEIEDMILLCASLSVDILTIGQYLQPSTKHWPVKEYITPSRFLEYKNFALENGIPICEAAPLQRSSFKAEEALSALEALKK